MEIKVLSNIKHLVNRIQSS